MVVSPTRTERFVAGAEVFEEHVDQSAGRKHYHG